METVKDYLVRKLRDAGQKRWPAIAAEISSELPVEKSVGAALLRKIACGDRDNPGVMTIQPVYDYLNQVEMGARKLPELADKAEARSSRTVRPKPQSAISRPTPTS